MKLTARDEARLVGLHPDLIRVIRRAAAAAEGVPIEWGGDWRTFKDGPHWQLPWGRYP